MTPLLISHAYRHRSSKAYWSFWLGLVLTFSGATLVHYNAFNNDPQWKKLPEINELKSHITDQKTVRFTPQTIPYFAAAGWSKNDYYMIRYFAYSNPEIFSLERFRSVIEESPTQVKPHSFIQKIINEWRWIFTDNNDRQLLMLQLLLTIGGICLLYPLNRKNFLLLIGTVLSTACVLIILSALYKINYRIYMPTVAYLGWLSLFLASRDQGKSKLYANYKKYTAMAFIGGALLILVSTNSTMRSTLAKSKENETKNSQFKSSLLKLAPEQHQLFVVWNTTFPFEAILPIEKHDYLNNFNVLSLGTYNQTPVQKRMLSPFNTNDPFFALASNSDVKLNFSPVFFPQLKTYLSQHYNISIELRSFYSDSNFTFYSGHSRKIKGASLP